MMILVILEYKSAIQWRHDECSVNKEAYGNPIISHPYKTEIPKRGISVRIYTYLTKN